VQERRLCRTIRATELSKEIGASTSPLRADAARNVQRILDTASRVLADDQGAGMAEVATEAGLARATLYRHFPTRADLVAAIRGRAYDEAGAAIAACRLEEGPVTDALRRLVDGLIAVGDRYRFLQNEAETRPEEDRKREEELSQPVFAMILRGQRSGELAADVNPRWVTRTLEALIRSALRGITERELTQAEASELVWRTTLRGVGGPEASQS
jgi:AcrR family transcriptional regulator